MSARGSTLVALVVALSVLGALAAIGMPSYVAYSEGGREAQCASNRHALETAERACSLDHNGKACLDMTTLVKSGYLESRPTCGSGGRYVWIVSDPDDSRYPSMGCSKHHFPNGDDKAEMDAAPSARG